MLAVETEEVLERAGDAVVVGAEVPHRLAGLPGPPGAADAVRVPARPEPLR